MRLLAKPHQWLAIGSFSVDYGTRVFVNGEEVRNVGRVSDNPEEAIPKVRYMTIPLYSGDTGEIEILYQYSNYVHNDGGFIQSTNISTPENIDEYQRGVAVWSLLLGSGLIFLMFWFLLCASIQKRREYAALALCCLVIACRNQFFFSEYLLDPDYNFYWEYRVMILDVAFIPATALYLLYAFFPKAIGRKMPCILGGVFVVITALHWILEIRDLVDLCHISYYCCIPFLLWSIFGILRYYLKEARPDRRDVLVLGAVGYLIVMLIREGVSSGESQMVTHFGITPFVMVICLMILAVVINARIQRQVVALEQVNQENQLLQQMNEMNRDFLRMVAHELKTPLTVISGYAQLEERQLEKGMHTDKSPGRLKTIRDEADRLGVMVSKLMDYTYGKSRDVEMSVVNVQDLLIYATSVMTPVCAKRENRLRFQNKGDYKVWGNAELLLQVLINLIANASRFTEKGVISIDIEEEAEDIVFHVSDTGCGISPEVVPHIFEKGYTTGGGNGLGLAVCLETVRLHDGDMELVSTGPNGTRFRFSIPKWKE
ncbi:MAG: hypothetical protein E7277_07645 [Lachnospiraceae bacterium]|nr:hypothetical protein [Lachnospiraceae bacterium]